MKIGIYTDIHCCYNSSILPTDCPDSKYTTRLKMIVDTFKWMYEVFNENNVDVIVNCGDLFDSTNVRSEELTAMSEALSYNHGCPEFHVLGNHEILDKNRNFCSTALLKNYSNITIIDSPCKTDMGISFLPYMLPENVSEAIPLIRNHILFSHIDIKGSIVSPGQLLDSGFSSDDLKNNFDMIINGHIHNGSYVNRSILNVGASTSLSFADNPLYRPRIAILDTETLDIQFIENPFAILFIKDIRFDSIEDIEMFLASHVNHRIVVRFSACAEIRDKVISYMENASNIITYRSKFDSIKNADVEEPDSSSLTDSYDNMYSSFRKFLEGSDDLKFPLQEYERVLRDLESGGRS